MQTEKVIEHIVKWLKDYHQSSHTKGFTIGVSGGIDSAIVSTLCARTGLPVLVIEMPIRQSSAEITRSRAHIKWLTSTFPNVTGAEVNLTEVFDAFQKTFQNSEINEINSYTEIALANTRSRLRMVRRFLINNLFRFVFLSRLIYIILLHLKVILLPVREIKLKILVLVSLQNMVNIN
jgi:NAD+ synthase